jgi:hypothetical protein
LMIQLKWLDLWDLRIVWVHIRISSGMSWGMIGLVENCSANVSDGDMWHDVAADRLSISRLLLFCQFLLPMGKCFQNYLFMNIGDTWYNLDTNYIHRRAFIASVSANRRPSDQIRVFQISDGFAHLSAWQLYTDYLEH